MTVYLVRHAKAGDRQDWDGDDRLRPLTKSGRRQAEGLVEVLKDDPIDTILCSPYLRCVQTVEPLAVARKLPVETTGELEEGAGGESVIRLTRKQRGHNVVLCTHGDVVQELLELLVKEGLVPRSRAQLEKGSTWALQAPDGRITGAKYRPAP